MFTDIYNTQSLDNASHNAMAAAECVRQLRKTNFQPCCKLPSQNKNILD